MWVQGDALKGNGKIWIFYDSRTMKQSKPLTTIHAQMNILNLKNQEENRWFIWTPGWPKWVPLHQFLESDQTYFVLAPSPHAPPAVPEMDDKTVKVSRPRDLSEDTITHIMHPGFEDQESGSEYTEILPDEKPSAQDKQSYGYYHEDFRADQLDPEAQIKVDMKLPGRRKKEESGSDRRTATRHEFKIEVILINKNGRTFRTKSLNISMGGTLLSDELPKEFINTRFDLILVNRFEKDPVKGRLHFQGRVVGDYTDPRRLMFMDTDEHTLKRLEVMLRAYVEQQKKLQKKKVS